MSSDDAPRAPAELVDDPDDPELSELLDSALADFGRPLPASASASASATATATATTSATASAPAAGSASALASGAASSSAGPEELNFSDAYKSFEEAMKQALKDAPAEGGQAEAAFSSMMANLAEEMAKTEVEGAEDPLAKTLADLSKTMTSDAEKMGGEPDMAELLRTFGGGGSGAAPDAASLDAFMPLMQTVMSSILSKDVLYPSLKDVSDRYPAWLAEHGPALAEPERQRYQRQHQLMLDVCAVFEEEAAGAEAERARQERVFQLMQQMQALGQPPKELVGESDLGIQFDSEGNPRLPAGLGAAAGAECSVIWLTVLIRVRTGLSQFGVFTMFAKRRELVQMLLAHRRLSEAFPLPRAPGQWRRLVVYLVWYAADVLGVTYAMLCLSSGRPCRMPHSTSAEVLYLLVSLSFMAILRMTLHFSYFLFYVAVTEHQRRFAAIEASLRHCLARGEPAALARHLRHFGACQRAADRLHAFASDWLFFSMLGDCSGLAVVPYLLTTRGSHSP
ncbi:peroxisomal biogenesis factor 19-like [Pollicipes pollicipes]|uniref:peroxisomal biogenesis factor 19-like n=1 Tax=Pollicipes pollicipes TaxID=41117 RepID=UPI001884B8FA|nr:peroxisomal biogenesis factor 19-like [Pollicipes pollicipes]